MVKYALDTNVISEYLRENESVKNHIVYARMNHIPLYIPSIAYYEIIRGFERISALRKLKEFYDFYELLEPIYLDRDDMEVLGMAAKIYASLCKNGKKIDDNDIFIAATAMAHDATLVTDNIKHFSRIEGLKLVNWKE